MNGQQKRRLVVAGVILLALLLGGTVWFVHGVVTWVRDLPNRVNVEVDDEQVANVLTSALTQAVKISLRDGEPKTQLETLEQLREGLRQAPESAAYYREEFLAEIQDLSNDDDERVAEAAQELVREIESADTSVSVDGDADATLLHEN
jgi:AcrR family transcriptional regulator